MRNGIIGDQVVKGEKSSPNLSCRLGEAINLTFFKDALAPGIPPLPLACHMEVLDAQWNHRPPAGQGQEIEPYLRLPLSPGHNPNF